VAKLCRVEGVKEAVNELKSVHSSMGNAAERGLKRAGLRLQRESMKEVPVDTGNLRSSAWSRKIEGSGFDAVVGVGYTASYALRVHENVDKAHGQEYNEKYAQEIGKGIMSSRGAGQKAKFLEDPAKRLADALGKMVAAEISKAIKKGL
jgi:hypothetical protein